MSAIADNTNVPVTVKCRIGVDDHDSYDELCEFLLLQFTNAFCFGVRVWAVSYTPFPFTLR